MESLKSDFRSILDDSFGSDLVISCPDGEVKVHRCILAGRSQVFRNLLTSDMEEKSTGIIKIEDFDIQVVRAMVLYMYSATIEDEFDDLVALMKIGNKYFIQALVDDCSTKLCGKISVMNVLDMDVVVELYCVQGLLESCAQFVNENIDVLEVEWKEKVQNSPLFLISIIEYMKKSSIGIDKPEVSRFESVHKLCTNYWGVRVDAVEVRLSHPAILTSVGLYGSENAEDIIPVKLTVSGPSSDTIFSLNTSYQSPGTAEPVRIPVRVKMAAHAKYTVSAVINIHAPLGVIKTFSGSNEKLEVNCGDHLKVNFGHSYTPFLSLLFLFCFIVQKGLV